MKAEQYPYSPLPSGHGHYTFLMQYRGKEYKTATDNMPAMDDFKSEEGQRDGKELRTLRGAKALRAEAIRKHNLK